MKDKVIQFFTTEEEKILLEEVSKRQSLSLASFCRSSAINKARQINQEEAVAV